MLSSGLPRYQSAVESAAELGDTEGAVRVRDTEGRTIYQHGDLSNARVITERSTGEMRLEVGSGSTAWRSALLKLRPVGFLLAFGALLLSLLGGLALTQRGLAPVRALATTAREVSRSGDLSRRVPERGTGDELDELSSLFNRMLARNQALLAGMRDALDNVAHDLRTPLTRLRGTAEVALRGEDPAATRDALGVCIEESDRVLVMLRALMDISEAETGLMRLNRSDVKLGRLAGEVTELYEQVAEDAGVAVSVTRDDAVIVSGDAARGCARPSQTSSTTP